MKKSSKKYIWIPVLVILMVAGYSFYLLSRSYNDGSAYPLEERYLPKDFMTKFMNAIKDKDNAFLHEHVNFKNQSIYGYRYLRTHTMSLGILNNTNEVVLDSYEIMEQPTDKVFVIEVDRTVKNFKSTQKISVEIEPARSDWNVVRFRTLHNEYKTDYKQFKVNSAFLDTGQGVYVFKGYSTPDNVIIEYRARYQTSGDTTYYELDGETEVDLAGLTLHFKKEPKNMLSIRGWAY